MDREHIGIVDAAQIDALLRLDRRQRREAVAIDRRALEIERLRGLLHLGGQLLLHRMALAGQKFARLAHQFVIVVGRDLAGAGRRAALDLEQQAGPRAAFEHRIRTGADQEGALQAR